ncbi:MAG: MFS transporter, partial [Anaerolineae bacterium]|nr:MFS transporter [Anaerolineae bacterium]
MLKRFVLYGLPLLADLIVGLVLFVGRHSLASRGFDEATVGSIVLVYGFGYVVSSLLMAKIVTPARAKAEMLISLASIALICLVLVNVQALFLMQVLYCIFPLVVSMYFNAFQIYMLGISNEDARPLAITIGRFTFSWSVGYAVGPFVSSLLKNYSTWAQIYYLAAGVAVVMGLLLYRFKPLREERAERVTEPVPEQSQRRSLVRASWVGLLLGWTGYNALMIYWPVQAVQLGVSSTTKGMVEFAFAAAQAVSALALSYVPGWHHKPKWLAGLGSLAVIALVLFSRAASAPLFVVAGLLYGTYLGGMWSHVAYHSMLEEDKAVRRVALNETFVGICFLIASPLAGLLHRSGTPFGGSYLRLAGILAVGLIAEV